MIAHRHIQNYLLLVYHISRYTGTVHTKKLENVGNKPIHRRVTPNKIRQKTSKKSEKKSSHRRVAGEKYANKQELGKNYEM